MGRISKWGTMLQAFDIKHLPHTTVMGQVLADLVAEFTKDIAGEEGVGPSVLVVSASSLATWEVYTDEVVNQKGTGVGIVLVSPEKIVVEKSLRLGFPATNNEAEYEALLARMAMVGKLGGEVAEVYSDSQLVVRQVNGKFEARDIRMQRYLIKVRHARSCFKSFSLE